MNKKTLSIVIYVFFSAACFLNAEERIVTLGGKDGWSKVEKTFRVATGKGKYGYDSLTLDTNGRKVSSSTDLLLDFEGDTVSDSAGNYDIVSNDILKTKDSKMGKGSGLSIGAGGLSLSGKNGSLFGTSGITGSFLIEFWIKPSVGENGERVFSWRSSRTVRKNLLYQIINAGFYKNHLEWSFTNVFADYTENNGQLTLSSYSTVIPNVWTHHAISYDSSTGLLEYRINGRLETLKYVTTNGKEAGGSICQCNLGVVAAIDICPEYTGLIDDFRIERTCESDTATAMRYDSYSRDGGSFVSEPLMISQDAELTKIDALLDTPNQTDIMMYVRSGDNYFSWDENFPEWIPVKNHSKIKNVKGLYFQFRADLYPDGDGDVSPSVMSVDMHFKEVEPPLPPFRVTAVASDSSVTLTWTYSVDNYTGGYYVFYGDRPGEYLGSEAVEGSSPVNVGNTNTITFNGLKNGKIYYFAVAAYPKVNEKIMGTLSKEVFARPLKK